MKFYAANRPLRERSGAAAREFILSHDYTRSGQASRFAQFYESILQQ